MFLPSRLTETTAASATETDHPSLVTKKITAPWRIVAPSQASSTSGKPTSSKTSTIKVEPAVISILSHAIAKPAQTSMIPSTEGQHGQAPSSPVEDSSVSVSSSSLHVDSPPTSSPAKPSMTHSGTISIDTYSGSTVIGNDRTSSSSVSVHEHAFLRSSTIGHSVVTMDSDTAIVVDGQTSHIVLQSTGSSGSDQKMPTVAVTSGHVLVDGETLNFGSTITLGTGTAATWAALETDSQGQTFVHGGSLAAATSSTGIGGHIISGLQGLTGTAAADASILTHAEPSISHSITSTTSSSSSCLRLRLSRIWLAAVGLTLLAFR